MCYDGMQFISELQFNNNYYPNKNAFPTLLKLFNITTITRLIIRYDWMQCKAIYLKAMMV